MDKVILNREVKEDRTLLLLSGIFNFPIGFVLYFYFKDKKGKEDYAKFARMGGYLGLFLLIFIIVSLLIVFIYSIMNNCF